MNKKDRLSTYLMVIVVTLIFIYAVCQLLSSITYLYK